MALSFETSSQPPDHIHVPLYVSIYTTFSYMLMFLFGSLIQFYEQVVEVNSTPKGYAPLLDGFNPFYTRHVYLRIAQCFNRPVGSLPGAWFDLYEREGSAFDGTLRDTGKIKRCLNLGSYNYLGFSESSCIDNDVEALQKYSPSNCGSRLHHGTSDIHRALERKVAEYLGKDDAIIFGMGYATNSTTIPALIGKGGLILSDTLNHASLVLGCRASGATVRVFEHNNAKDLERKLKAALKSGQTTNNNKPWEKILIIIEGLYSMEGDIALLPEIVQLKKKYKAYLYIDEAHSIGAIGRTGRGVCEYSGVNTGDVDVLMGTFTKSFASSGGYIAASQDIINSLRSSSFSSYYDTSMSPVCAQQTITVLNTLMGKDGTSIGADRIVNLRKNSIYFRKKLKERGFIVLGNFDSPVIPLVMYSPVVMTSFSTKCLERNLAIVVVGYPATDLMLCRARFCMSSAHKIEDLDFALREIDDIGEAHLLRFHPVKASLP